MRARASRLPAYSSSAARSSRRRMCCAASRRDRRPANGRHLKPREVEGGSHEAGGETVEAEACSRLPDAAFDQDLRLFAIGDIGAKAPGFALSAVARETQLHRCARLEQPDLLG